MVYVADIDSLILYGHYNMAVDILPAMSFLLSHKV